MGKKAAFICMSPSEKRSKELKGPENKGLTQGLDIAICHDLKSTPSVVEMRASFFRGVARPESGFVDQQK